MCRCGAVQTVRHILTTCPLSRDVRDDFPEVVFDDYAGLWSDDPSQVCCMYSIPLGGGVKVVKAKYLETFNILIIDGIY